jgi:ribosomal protein S20
MPPTISLTLNEAGYVVGQSHATIDRAVDRGVIKAARSRRAASNGCRPTSRNLNGPSPPARFP